MRRYLIILMIALLPLRSWAGDWMALSMSMPEHAVQSASVELAVHQPSGDLKDCAGHSGAKIDVTAAGAADNTDCKTCVACQICHSVALMNLALPAASANDAAHLRAAPAATFVSAMPGDSVKPPIS